MKKVLSARCIDRMRSESGKLQVIQNNGVVAGYETCALPAIIKGISQIWSFLAASASVLLSGSVLFVLLSSRRREENHNVQGFDF